MNSSTSKQSLDLYHNLTKIKDKNATEFTAQKMRDQLQPVIAKPKILNKFVRGDIELEEAYERAKISNVQEGLKRLLNKLKDIELTDIGGLDINELRSVEQIVRKMHREQQRIKDMVKRSISSHRNR